MQLTHTPEEQRDNALIDRLNSEFDIVCKYLSQHLMGRLYACGDQFTAADCVLGYSGVVGVLAAGGLLAAPIPGAGCLP